MSTEMSYVLWSCPNEKEAKHVIHTLLDERLIACASIFPVMSIYRWEGKIEEEQEVKVLLKTRTVVFNQLCSRIQDLCSYEVPEVTQLPVEQANPEYLSWLTEEVPNIIE